jgi:uncharacterized membrane protein
MADKTQHTRETRQLRRLEVLIDVVYAVVLWRIFMLIPRPGKENWAWDSIGSFLMSGREEFLIVVIGVVIVIIYWLQNNTLLGNLKRTDNKHTALSILQIFFLLLFLYAIRLGISFNGSSGTKALESCMAVLMGVASAWGWSYALKKGLLLPDVSDADARQTQHRVLAEPITAAITIPFAFIGPILWEVTWLSYPLVVRHLNRRKRSENQVT